MNPKIFLARPMGHTGGYWIWKSCDFHPQIEVYSEKVKSKLKLAKVDKAKSKEKGLEVLNYNQLALDEYFMDKLRGCKKEAFGTVKISSPKLDEQRIKNNGRLLRIARNPVSVVAYFMYKFLRNFDKTKSQQVVFEENAKQFSIRYRGYIDGGDKLVKLEDLNDSVYDDYSLFRDTFEWLTRVEWDDDLICKSTKLHEDCTHCDNTGTRPSLVPCSRCFGTGRYHEKDFFVKCDICRGKALVKGPNDNCMWCGGKDYRKNNMAHEQIWNGWADWQKEIFRKHFDVIMNDLDYKRGT